MRYPALRVIVVVHYVLAIIIMTAAWTAVLTTTETLVRAGIAIGGIIAVVLLVGFAELLRVVMDIEENTRAAGSPAVEREAAREERGTSPFPG